MTDASALDRPALEALYVRLERPIYNVVYRRLWNSEEAVDVVQESFVRLWDARERVRIETVEPFVWRIALNLSAKRVRSRRLWGWLPWDSDDRSVEHAGEAAMVCIEADREVRAAVDALPEKLRAVVLLCEFSEMSHAQVADTLGIPSGTVASRRHLAMERLRGMLEPS